MAFGGRHQFAKKTQTLLRLRDLERQSVGLHSKLLFELCDQVAADFGHWGRHVAIVRATQDEPPSLTRRLLPTVLSDGRGIVGTGSYLMPQKVTKSQRIDHQAIALIDRRISEIGLLWHERPRDFGIDGEIALTHDTTSAVTGHQLLVQSKGSERSFPGETETGFHYIVKRRDLEGWLTSRIPVLLVCSRPSTQEAFFKPIQDWFCTPERVASRRVEFDKELDRLDTSARYGLEAAARRTHVGSAVSPPTRRETLRSNLLRIEHWPARINFAKAAASTPREAWKLLREYVDDPPCDWRLREGRIEAFGNLADGALAPLVAGPVESVASEDWALSDELPVEHAFAELLGLTIQQMFADDLAWHRERGYLYFRPTEDLTIRRVAGAREGVGVAVFRPYMKKRDPSEVGYYRHAALRRRFIRVENDWYLALLPTYHFTFDGRRESYWAADMLAGIKRLERNDAVRASTETWARFLRTGQEGSMLADPAALRFGELLSFEVEHGVDDRAWQRPVSRTSRDTDLNLFDAA